jgi:hypothetical protein
MEGEARQNSTVFVASNDSIQTLPPDLLRHLHHLLAKPEVCTLWAPGGPVVKGGVADARAGRSRSSSSRSAPT